MSTKIEPQPEANGLSHKLKTSKKKKEKVTKFIEILFSIFEGPPQPGVLSWTEDGTGIQIHNHVEFSENILPKFFKHNNFASFIRQLNIYGFKKIKSETCENHYSHPMFRRGRKDLLSRVKRKKVSMKDTKGAVAKPAEASGEEGSAPNVDRAVQENVALKKQQKELSENLMMLNQRIEKLSADNEMLTERYMSQHQQIEKLKFMVLSRNPQNNSGLNPLLNSEIQQMAPEFGFPGMPQQFTNLMRTTPQQAGSIQHFQMNQSPLQQQQPGFPQHQQLFANQQQQQLMMRQQQIYGAMGFLPPEQAFVENPGMRLNLPMQGADPSAFVNGNMKINAGIPTDHVTNPIELLELNEMQQMQQMYLPTGNQEGNQMKLLKN